ncbi:hypothetical protein [uncultured Campylobacter sp.]|nr:hypothetical protein [uncultured Campylobacter sp.]
MTPNFGEAGLSWLNLSGVNLMLAKFGSSRRRLVKHFSAKFCKRY